GQWVCIGLEATRFQDLNEFADADCAQPILRATGSVPTTARPTVAAPRVPSCHWYRTFFEVGTPVPAGIAYALVDGKCTRVTPPANVTLIQRGKPVAGEQFFVLLKPQTGKTAGGLASVHLKGSDGSLVAHGFHDVKLDLPCTFKLASDGKVRCLPDTVSTSVGDYSDSACTSRVALLDLANECDVDRPFINQSVSSTCPMQVEVYRNAGTTSQGYSMSNGQCTATGLAARRLTLGAQVPITDFPEGQIATIPSSSSSSRMPVLAAGGPVGSLDVSFFDAKHGEECWPGNAADGVSRCLLGAFPLARNAFADDACTKPAVIPGGTCDGKFVYLDGRVHRKGDVAKQPYVRTQDGGCALSVSTAGPYVEVGEEIPASDLIPLRHEVED
ncbi:MAG TPA: hypothetical protein VGF45_01405, partial [Polyangia bacterium]